MHEDDFPAQTKSTKPGIIPEPESLFFLKIVTNGFVAAQRNGRQK